MLIVAAGARGDLGQHDAAVVMLQVAELDVPPRAGSGPARQARARLMSAYADALAAAGRDDEARVWLEKAADADLDGSTGAAERLGWVGWSRRDQRPARGRRAGERRGRARHHCSGEH